MPDETDVADLLSRLEVSSTPSDAFASRLRERIGGELAMESPASATPSARVVSLPASTNPGVTRRLPARRVRTALPALGAAACVLAIAAFYVMVVSQVAPPARTGNAGADYDLYTVAGSLTQIDPTTLADLDDQPQQSSSADLLPSPIATSADGSLIAVVEPVKNGDDTTYRVNVIEAQTGEERVSIPWKYPIESLAFNADGSRLGLVTLSGTIETMPGWHTYDVATGALLSNKPIDIQDDPPWRNVVQVAADPLTQRAYRLVVPVTWSGSMGDPFPYVLIHDLLTGERIGRIELPNVRAGVVDEIDPYYAEFMPAMTLSPDGNQLILVDATDGAVTIVDTVGLRVDRTFVPRPKVSKVGQLMAILGLSPATASAKGMSRVALEAGVSADGASLLIWDASPERVTAEGTVEPTDRRGLQVIDLETGTILHGAFSDTQILDVVPSPNDDALFVTVATGYDDRGNSNAYALWRLDSDLTRTAESPFTVEPHVVIATS